MVYWGQFSVESGFPNVYVHNLVAHCVQTVRDSKTWPVAGPASAEVHPWCSYEIVPQVLVRGSDETALPPTKFN